MKFVIIVNIVLLCIVFNDVISGQRTGDSCIDNDKIGKCKPMADCATAHENFNKTIFPKICSFNRLVVIVCCNDLPTNGTIVKNSTQTEDSGKINKTNIDPPRHGTKTEIILDTKMSDPGDTMNTTLLKKSPGEISKTSTDLPSIETTVETTSEAKVSVPDASHSSSDARATNTIMPSNETTFETITEDEINISNASINTTSSKINPGEASEPIEGVELQFVNKEDADIWVAIMPNEGKELVKNGGFILKAKATMSIGVPEKWAGVFWGRTHCDPVTQRCLTGDCGNGLECRGEMGVPPFSRIEVTLKGYLEQDFYDVSLIEGFNLPVSIEPIDGVAANINSCRRPNCSIPLNNYCPDNLKVNSVHGVVGCMSACRAFKSDIYCKGYKKHIRVPQILLVKYSTYFKFNCPKVYSFPFDDNINIYTCQAQKYKIIFGV